MILSLSEVFLSFRKKEVWWKRGRRQRVLNGVTFNLKKGECLGLVGESGSGKSTLAKVIIGAKKPDKGLVVLDGQELYSPFGHRAIYGKISVVFQDYTSSVNPFFTVRKIMAEPLTAQGRKVSEIEEGSVDLLEKVGLGGEYLDRYPHELSGGQLQRICLARAVSTRPRLIVLDEAVSSLDISVSIKILDLLLKLKEDYGLSYLFITHDLTAVTYMCDRALFFNGGRVIEEATRLADLRNLKEPYSRDLLHAASSLDWLT